MIKIANVLERIAKQLEKILSFISITILVILISIVFFQVAFRFFTDKSVIEIEELSTVLASWIAFLTIAYAIRRKVHVAIDFFVGKLPVKAQLILTEVINIGLLLILGSVTIASISLVMRKMNVPMTILPIKTGYWYMSFPIGMTIGCFFLINDIVQGINKLTGQSAEEEVEL